MDRGSTPGDAARPTSPPDHGGCTMRAVETVISAWIAEQERTAKRSQTPFGFAQSDGTSAPPSSATREPNRSSAAEGQILPATSASPSPNAGARASSPGGTNENTSRA